MYVIRIRLNINRDKNINVIQHTRQKRPLNEICVVTKSSQERHRRINEGLWVSHVSYPPVREGLERT